MRWIRFAPFVATLLVAACGQSAAPVQSADLGAAPDLGSSPDGSGVFCATDVKPAPGIAFTHNGPVQGVTAGATWKYLGIPFAKPPVGELRFQPPQAPLCNPTLLLADHFAAQCPQLDDKSSYLGDEDCLYLNVWTPKDPAPAGGRPVLFFVHGGGFVQGSASTEVVAGTYLYDGQSLAEQHGAVVVTANYRLGALGYLAHPALAAESPSGLEGNNGTLDQVAALGWVAENIDQFGGDPRRVLLFGESAGAVSVCTLLATPMSRGYFSSALMESGACVAQTKQKAETLGAKVVQAAQCDTASDVAACLRALSAEALVKAFPVMPDVAGIAQYQYGAVIDGYVVTESPLATVQKGNHHHVPLVVGVNSDETSRYSPAIATDAQYQAVVLALAGGNQTLANLILAQYPSANYATPRAAYVALSTDAKFICTARQVARAAVMSQSEPVYRYYFAEPLQNSVALKPFGAFHSIELFFVFGQTHAAGYVPTPGETALSDAIQGYWTRLSDKGDPNSTSAGVVAWPKYDAATDPYLQLKADAIVAGAGLRTAQCDFWDSFK